MVEWDGLENRCGPRVHRGFESLPPRWRKARLQRRVFYLPPSALFERMLFESLLAKKTADITSNGGLRYGICKYQSLNFS